LKVYWRDLSPPDVGHYLAELSEQILCVLFFILYTLYLVVLWFDCRFTLHLVARLDLGLLVLLARILVIGCH